MSNKRVSGETNMTAEQTLDAVRNVLQRAYNSAEPVCCGRAGTECCGSPEPEWSEYDQQIMNDLQPVEAYLSQALSAPRVPDGVGEAVYQIKLPGDSSATWCDASEDAYKLTSDRNRRVLYALTASPEPEHDELRFADARLIRRALQSLRLGDTADADKCIETVLKRSPDFVASPEPVAPQPVCVVCDGKGSVETDNNGPIVVCPVCRYDDPKAPAVAQANDQQLIADLRAEVEALKDALGFVKIAILEANDSGLIADTLWATPQETLVDYIDAARQREGGE